MVYLCPHDTLQKIGTWFCCFVTSSKLICYFTSFYVLKFCLCYLLRSRMHTLTCCATHAQHPLQRDPGYTALTFTWFPWKSMVAEGPGGAELNRIITEQTLTTHSMVQKMGWFVGNLLDYLTNGSDNNSLYNTTAVFVYYCMWVVDVLKIFKAAFSNILSLLLH